MIAHTKIDWTTGMVRSVTLALRTTLGRVPRESLAQPKLMSNWTRVQDWLDIVDRLMSQPDWQEHLDSVPPFPLDQRELEILQSSVDHIAAAQAALSAGRVIPKPQQLHRSWTRAFLSSYPLVALLILTPAVNAFNILALHGRHEQALLIINGAAVFLGIGLWLLHRSQLTTHKSLLNDIHPQVAM